MNRIGYALFTFFLLHAAHAAEPTLPAFTSRPGLEGATDYSVSLQTLLAFTLLSFLPAALLMMTSFTRIIIVLGLLKQAIGIPQSPPNQVLVGLTLFLTFFIMSPTLEKVYQQAYVPFSKGELPLIQALETGSKPLKSFMLRQTRQKDLALFVQLADSPTPSSPEELSLKTLVPAYVISELKTAFQIGFLIYLPFLIIDMVVASVLMAMGMMMLSPITISLPFKLMLFVLVDGWALLMSSLVKSFYI